MEAIAVAYGVMVALTLAFNFGAAAFLDERDDNEEGLADLLVEDDGKSKRFVEVLEIDNPAWQRRLMAGT